MRAGPAGPRARGERGHLMAGLVVAVAILMIASTVAVQQWSDVLRRDNEAEMIFRGLQYARAIWHYRQINGTGPQKLEDLMEATGPGARYVLRRLYTDPLVPDGKWGLLYEGPGGQIVDPHAMEEGEGLGTGPFGSGPGSADPFGSGSAAGGSRLQSGLGADRQQQAGRDPRATGRSRSSLGNLGEESSVAAGGGEVTGLPIAGVRSLCDDRPFRVYKEQTEYAKWLFTWQEIDRLLLPGQQQMQQPGQQPGQAPQQPQAGGRRGGAGPGAGRRGQPPRVPSPGQPGQGRRGRNR